MAIPPDEVRGVGIVVSKLDGQQAPTGRAEGPGDARQGALSDLWKAGAKVHPGAMWTQGDVPACTACATAV